MRLPFLPFLPSLTLALALSCPLARADALSDLKTLLATVDSREPLRAAVTFEASQHQADEPKGEAGRVSARIEDGPAGLQIAWPREIVDRAAAEEAARAKDRNLRARTRSTMDALNATTLNNYLNAAPQLLQQLGLAELVSEQADTCQGQPARLLVLKITPPMSDKDKKYLKQVDVTGKLWLGADGWPLAAEQTLHLKGRAFLVITFEQHERQELRYARTGSRLVTVYHARTSENSGGGEHGHSQSLAVLTVEKS